MIMRQDDRDREPPPPKRARRWMPPDSGSAGFVARCNQAIFQPLVIGFLMKVPPRNV